MKIETLHFKRKRYFLYVLVVGVLLLLPLVLSITFGKYQTKESIKLAEGSVTYKPYDFKIMAMYQEIDSGAYEEIETMPRSGYIINEEKSYCTIDNINKDNNAVLKTMNGNHIVSNLNKNEKCYIWFNKVSTIQNIIETHNLEIRSDFSTTLTADTTGTLFMAPDDDGTSYYYAGAVQDNWVKFAGFYWRIIRINGDRSIRMIYQGTAANTTGTGTQIGTSPFNSEKTDYMYVGYMYTSGSVHGTGTASTIKGILDSWYDSNLESYASYIDTNAGFCGDRTPYTSNDGTTIGVGTGTTTTCYGTYIRLYNSESASNATPIFKCPDSSTDLYTISSSNKGNKALNKPIGLITADEVAYAGGVVSVLNSSYYLHTNQPYWTMSPSYYNIFDGAYEFLVLVGGWLGRNNGGGVIWDEPGVRPVINLKADTTFSSGDGTIDNPYIVS